MSLKTEPQVGVRIPTNAWKTFWLALPMALLSFVFLGQGSSLPSNPLELIPLLLTYGFVNVIFILMVRTGKTDKYRAALFVTYAVAFVISFIANLIEIRGSMAYTQENIFGSELPFCHIVTPMVIIPAALTRTIIFPGSLLEGFASIGSMLVLVAGVLLTLGRGFCSWGCFYGGLEDGISRISKKPRWKFDGSKWRYLPFAVLLAVVLTTLATLSPTYCVWLCPFKAVTEYEKVTSPIVLIQTIIFLGLFIGLVVVLPFLTKRRTQCALLCPFGAFASFANKIDPFAITIDRDKCVDCRACAGVCPNFSLDSEAIKSGKPKLTCLKCGKCVDRCPKGAITFRIKGTTVNRPFLMRMLFLYPAFIMLTAMGGGTIMDGLHRILLLITTGSIIR